MAGERGAGPGERSGASGGGLGPDDLAARSGTTPERIERLARLGILSSPEPPFQPADEGRVRMAAAFEASGVSIDDVGRAVADGLVSFAFVDLLHREGTDLLDTTYGDLARDNGLSLEALERMHTGLGLPTVSAGDRVRRDDAEMLPIATMALGIGLGEAEVARSTRVWGEHIRRLAEAASQFFDQHVVRPGLAAGASEQQVMEAAAELGRQMQPILERFMVWLFRRHNEHEVTQTVLEHLERTMERAGVLRARVQDPPAIVFLDLSGYTALTEERGDEVAAELAASLASLVQERSHARGGRLVKLLGDGVMFYFRSPSAAVLAALEMVERAPLEGLPPAHAGVNAGPVILREGDCFGRTVNVASRISSAAGPGEVLVGEEVVRTAEGDGVAFDEVGPTALKGLAQPVTLYRASLRGDRPAALRGDRPAAR